MCQRCRDERLQLPLFGLCWPGKLRRTGVCRNCIWPGGDLVAVGDARMDVNRGNPVAGVGCDSGIVPRAGEGAPKDPVCGP